VPISVGVFIDLCLRPESGGHVKCWQRFAEAATAFPDRLNLTLHFLGNADSIPVGRRAGSERLAPNVEYRFHRPRLGSDRLPCLKDVADQTDLACLNPRLYPEMAQHDILHTTHQLFTFGKTAQRFAQQTGKPLVSSIHTDVPRYAELYTRQVIEKLLGRNGLSRFFTQTLQLPALQRRRMQHQLDRYWPHCHHVWVAQAQEYDQVSQVLPAPRISRLRRGIDKQLFHPAQRDRQRLLNTYSIPSDRLIVLFVGRINLCKNVLTFAHALRQLLEAGYPVQPLLVGQGSSATAVQQVLGPSALLVGNRSQHDLAWIYASSDLFVFPSETETTGGNVVIEAKACGLPVITSDKGGATQLMQEKG
jgi:glycosyltransferase involved in cell wall biosynthesis